MGPNRSILPSTPHAEDDVVDDHADGEYAEGESFEEV